MEAIKEFGMLEYASDKLRDDRTILAAVKKRAPLGSVLQYVSQSLRSDRQIVGRQTRCRCVEYASDELRDDRQVMKAVQQFGGYFQFIDRLKGDRKSSWRSSNIPAALEYASETLRVTAELSWRPSKNPARLEYASTQGTTEILSAPSGAMVAR